MSLISRSKALYALLRAAIVSLRRYRRLALKAFELYLPAPIAFALSKLVDPFFRLSAVAARYGSTLPIDRNLVMYESYNGRDFAGNPFALFKHLLDRPDYARLRHVVVVPSLDHPKLRAYRRHPRVRLVRVDSASYVRYAETCGYFINNASYKPYLIKRTGQNYVYTWHSTLLKKLALDKGAPWEARNVNRALVSADYFISPNRFTTELLLSSHGASPFTDGLIAEFGYPRNDLTINADKTALKRSLGIGENEKLVLFAPTWRGEQNAVNTVSETLEQRRLLEGALPDGYRVLVKFHTMVYRFLDRPALKFCAPLGLDANELLAAADFLVTDYSGIFFDYLPTGNPIVFFVPDRAAYGRAKNGFYLDLETLPGPLCEDIDSTAAAVIGSDSIRDRYAAAYADFRNRFVADDDGRACERVVDLVFGGKGEARTYRLPRGKKRILLFPGPLNPNGVTTSFLALTRSLDYDRYDVAVMISDEERNRVFQADIDRRAGVFYQTAPDAFSASEYAAHVRFIRDGSRKAEDIPAAAYRRSARRVLYDLEFDVAVNFHGYQPADAAKIALGISAGRRAIFLHNDLNRDRAIKQPQLHAVFSTYKYYDRLFCVSADSLAANMAGTAAYVKSVFGDDIRPKMDYAPNLISPQSIIDRSKETLPPSVPPPSQDHTNFMTIGRLSPEKNHLRLFEAFRKVVDEFPDSRLYVVGDGKTAGALKRKARTLRLTDEIRFIRFMANPYPLFRACDCFVLSSDIEGQPVTILEALTLGLPVIATDIAGPRDLLEGGYGSLVALRPDALAEAMVSFIRSGKRPARKRFDAESYVKAAGARFAAKVLEGSV